MNPEEIGRNYNDEVIRALLKTCKNTMWV